MKKTFSLIAKLLVSLLLVGILLHAADPAPVLDRMTQVNGPGILVVLSLVLFQITLVGWRWQLITRTCGTGLSFRDAQVLTFIGQFFNQTLPSTIGGDVVRVVLATRAGMPVARATSSVLADRVVALLALMLMAAATLPLFYTIILSHAMRTALTLLVAGGLCGFALCLLLGEWMARFIPFKKLSIFMAEFTRDMRCIMPTSRHGGLIMTLSILTHFMTVAVMFMMARMMSIPLGFLDAMVLIPPVILLTVLPISLAGWGIREGVMVFILGKTGIVSADALALSLAFGLLISFAGLPGGVLWILRKGKAPHAGATNTVSP